MHFINSRVLNQPKNGTFYLIFIFKKNHTICNLMVLPSSSMVRIFWNVLIYFCLNNLFLNSLVICCIGLDFPMIEEWLRFAIMNTLIDLRNRRRWWRCRTQCRCRRRIAAADTTCPHPSHRLAAAWTGSRCKMRAFFVILKKIANGTMEIVEDFPALVSFYIDFTNLGGNFWEAG